MQSKEKSRENETFCTQHNTTQFFEIPEEKHLFYSKHSLLLNYYGIWCFTDLE